jgi:hypothetical protein
MSEINDKGIQNQFKGQVHKNRGGRVFLNFNDVTAFDTLDKEIIVKKIEELMI